MQILRCYVIPASQARVTQVQQTDLPKPCLSASGTLQFRNQNVHTCTYADTITHTHNIACMRKPTSHHLHTHPCNLRSVSMVSIAAKDPAAFGLM